MWIDAHCHLEGNPALVTQQQQEKMMSLINCQSPAEFEINHALTKASTNHYLSAGIHPWYVRQGTFREMLPIFELVPVIGEIGLDNLWTDIPLSEQRPLFSAQLEYAAAKQKPVILHTKGCEEEILKTIKTYPNTYLVHWYSTSLWQADYLELDCYFTIGPDLETNPHVAKLAKRIPLNRLLIESDGLNALSWAHNQSLKESDYLPALAKSYQLICQWRGLELEELKELVAENFRTFLNI